MSGRNAVGHLVNITGDGLSYAREEVSGMPAVIELGPGSLVLTAFGPVNRARSGAIARWPTGS